MEERERRRRAHMHRRREAGALERRCALEQSAGDRAPPAQRAPMNRRRCGGQRRVARVDRAPGPRAANSSASTPANASHPAAHPGDSGAPSALEMRARVRQIAELALAASARHAVDLRRQRAGARSTMRSSAGAGSDSVSGAAQRTRYAQLAISGEVVVFGLQPEDRHDRAAASPRASARATRIAVAALYTV